MKLSQRLLLSVPYLEGSEFHLNSSDKKIFQFKNLIKPIFIKILKNEKISKSLFLKKIGLSYLISGIEIDNYTNLDNINNQIEINIPIEGISDYQFVLVIKKNN